MRTHLKTALATLFLAAVLVAGAGAGEPDPNELCDLNTDNVASCELNACLWVAGKLGLKVDFCLDGDAQAEAESQATALAQEKQSEAGSAAKKILEQKNTGTGSALASTSSSSDFLSKLAVSALGGVEDDDGNVTLELTDLFGLDSKNGYKLTAQLRQAEVFDKLLEQFPEDTRSSKKDVLAKQLGDLDDVVVAFSFNPTNEKWGRSWKPHDNLWDALFESVKAKVEPLSSAVSVVGEKKEKGKLIQEIVRLFLANDPTADVDDLINQVGSKMPFKDIAAVDPEAARRLLVLTVEDKLAWVRRNAALDKALDEAHFVEMADLIDNQRQLVIDASGTFRDDLVGPDEWKLKATWEQPLRPSVNTLRASLGECLPGTLADEVDQLLPTAAHQDGRDAGERTRLADCHAAFFADGKFKRADKGDRVAVSVEYKDVQSYDHALPDDQVTLALAGSESITGSVAYGRYVDYDAEGKGRSRIDFSYSYESVDEDMKLRNSRQKAELTYAQRISGDLFLSTGLVWADKPEFRGDVEEEFSARLGLKYKLFKKEG